MAGFAVFIGAKMASPLFLSEGVFLAVIAAFLICGAGNTINDFFDFEIDKVNSPGRPLPAGTISLTGAYRYSLLLFSTGIALSLFINAPALFLATINFSLLYLYAKTIKKGGGLTKNLTVSYLVASPFLFGGIAVGNPRVTLFLVFLAFFVNTAREVVKDIEDYKGDLGQLESLPVKHGFRAAASIASIFIVVSIFLSSIPYELSIVTRLYLLFIVPADMLLAYCLIALIRSPREKSGRVQRLIKAGMALALMGFFLGSL
jgi:geranylgeranylglycerol-phosphate geranylgeranyltransferase